MSDIWLNDYENVQRQLNQLAVEINDYAVQQRNNPVMVRKDTPIILRRSLVNISSEISKLQDNLTYGNLRLLEKELLRRRNLVEGLITRKTQLSNTFDSAVNNTALKNELFGPETGKRVWGKPAKETEQTKQYNNQQLYQNQKDVMKEQDEQLDMLSHSLLRQKNMANEMNKELDIHNQLLDDVEIGTEAVTHRLTVTNSKLETLKQNAGSCCMIVVIVLLIIVTIVVLATQEGCKIYYDPNHC
eukprot:gene2004-2466_t